LYKSLLTTNFVKNIYKIYNFVENNYSRKNYLLAEKFFSYNFLLINLKKNSCNVKLFSNERDHDQSIEEKKNSTKQNTTPITLLYFIAGYLFKWYHN